MFVSAVTEHELYSYPHLTPVEVARIDALFTTLTVIDVDSRIAQLSGQLRATYGIKALNSGTKLPTARQEIHEALRNLSRRPEPGLTGAIHHAMDTLDCTAREVTGDLRATLGEILKRHSDLLPKPIDEAASKLWGYASDVASHLREGRSPARPEAELLVGTVAALGIYLAEKLRETH